MAFLARAFDRGWAGAVYATSATLAPILVASHKNGVIICLLIEQMDSLLNR
jgi:hypothetical protein